MELHGQHLLGQTPSRDGSRAFRALDPTTGDELATDFVDATELEVDRALRLADDAFAALEMVDRTTRAAFLDQIARNLLDLQDALVERANAETGLPTARLVGECGRTVGQLRLFAEVVREGSYLGARIDRADPDRQPIPKPDIRRLLVPIGPVVVFGASNFPLAFSVAGGDTASALAAGCPVVAKAHPAHPGTSELVGRAILDAVATSGLPDGTFSLIQGLGHVVGLEMVRHPLTRAVGFTGSLGGGRALFDAAAKRPTPIPVFAEMGSTNPLFLLPGAVAERGEALATGLAGSVVLGVGQFCTNPGLIVVVDSPETDALIDHLTTALADSDGLGAEGTMLHGGIRQAFDAGIDKLAGVPGVEVRTRGEANGPCGARPTVLTTDAATFASRTALAEEVFGPSTLVVRCPDIDTMIGLAHGLVGQLTAGMHRAADGSDDETAARLLPILTDKAGRVLFDGYPTGVEVVDSMQHGGPYPSTTDPRTTSVGTAAIERWLRPVAYQNCPEALLPDALRDTPSAPLWRRVDGVFEKSE
ncbi:MAG: aldehyde dehydrogenase (NADP(+)) [Acidobacteriota bacterium]